MPLSNCFRLPRCHRADVPEGQREKRAAEDRNRRSVALAVCRLLLGDAAGAEAALGLAGEGAVPRCDRTVLQFIKVGRRGRRVWGK